MLDMSVVWDQVSAAFQSSSGAGVENVDEAIQLLPDAKPARVLMAQVRQPVSDRNGREGQAQGGRKPPVDEKGVAELRQELAESRNTIYQLRTNQETLKRQRRDGWQGGWSGQDHQSTEQPGPKNGVHVLEGTAAAKGPKPQLTSPARFKPTCCGPADDPRTQTRS